MKNKLSSLLIVLTATLCAAAQSVSHFDGQTWWNHVKFLADDKLEGRDTGSRGDQKSSSRS